MQTGARFRRVLSVHNGSANRQVPAEKVSVCPVRAVRPRCFRWDDMRIFCEGVAYRVVTDTNLLGPPSVGPTALAQSNGHGENRAGEPSSPFTDSSAKPSVVRRDASLLVPRSVSVFYG